jgi:hypothetical protein
VHLAANSGFLADRHQIQDEQRFTDRFLEGHSSGEQKAHIRGIPIEMRTPWQLMQAPPQTPFSAPENSQNWYLFAPTDPQEHR